MDKRYARKVFASFLVIAALISALLSLAFASSEDLVDHTIRHSRTIQAHLLQGAHFTDSVIEKEGRLPNEAELKSWSGFDSRSGPLFWSSPPFEQKEYEGLDVSGPYPPNAYMISYWRGEWFEYYLSWNKTTSLTFETEGYYILGGPIQDSLLMASLSLIMVWLAYKIWPRVLKPNFPKKS